MAATKGKHPMTLPLPSDLTRPLMAAIRAPYSKDSMLNSYAATAGFLQSLVEGLPDTPENRAYISRMINVAESIK